MLTFSLMHTLKEIQRNKQNLKIIEILCDVCHYQKKSLQVEQFNW